MNDKNINSLDIRKEILSSFNSEKTIRTIENILNVKGIHNYSKELYVLYEREADRLVRNSFLIKKNGHSYVISKNDEDKYCLEKAGMMDKFMNFLNNS